ncbi:MAG TPA: HD domain-containing protein [Sphingobacteriaceae bacterium]|nr:HD domain-containing protein [Sphingobacteriaceae bacterium]
MLSPIDRAVQLAVTAHQGQRRKGKDMPYITHPVSVALTLATAGCSEEVVIAGLLHDTLEDTEVRAEHIEEEFGPQVLAIVKSCTEDKRLTWWERKRHTVDSLPREPLAVKLVVAADKLQNVRELRADYAEIGDALWDRFRAGKEEQAWYYQSIVKALKPEIEAGVYPTIFDVLAEEVYGLFGPGD